MADVPLITRQADLGELCRVCREAGALAFDTEFIRDDTYFSALALLQVACGEQVWLVDPTTKLDLAEFWELVADPRLTKIVHAGKEDLEIAWLASGQPPRTIFDVQIAAGFVGMGYPLSLSRLVHAITNKRLAKFHTLTDWMRRPLSDEQIAYAVEDVQYLARVHAALDAALRREGRLEWALEEFAQFEDPSYYRPPVQERLFKLKGSKKLDGLGLAVLERLVEWRARWAMEHNRPARVMVRDDILVEIARRRPTRPQQIEILRGFPAARSRKVVAELLAVVADGMRTPPERWPTVYEPRIETPMERAVVDLLSAYSRAVCHDEKLDQDLVGGSALLRELVDHLRDGHAQPQPMLLRGWRREFIGARLVELMQGKRRLFVDGWPRHPHLRVAADGQPAPQAARSPREAREHSAAHGPAPTASAQPESIDAAGRPARSPTMRRWLVKSDPDDYSAADLERDGTTAWTGVRNAVAQKHLQAMRPNDEVLLYHTGDEKALVATASISAAPQADATDPEGKAMQVVLKFGAWLASPVPLRDIKADEAFAEFDLVRIGRLSVMPVPAALWSRLMKMAGGVRK